MAILDELRREFGLAMLFITHDLELAAAICDRTAVMYAGRIVEIRDSALLHSDPLHPYTAALSAARPDIDRTTPAAAGDPRPAAVGVRGAAGRVRVRAALPARRRTSAAPACPTWSSSTAGLSRCARAARAARTAGGERAWLRPPWRRSSR